MRIAIYGLSKSGTSALFSLLEKAMPPDTDCYFEPGKRHRRQFLVRRAKQVLRPFTAHPLLVKDVLFDRNPNHRNYAFGLFDHEILILRDPRDRLISYLLYGCYNSSMAARPEASAAFVRLLRQKECAPETVGLVALIQAAVFHQDLAESYSGWMDDYRRDAIDGMMRFADENAGVITLRYEDMVDGDLAELSRRTRLHFTGPAEVGPGLHRVVRTKQRGNWRDWFTADDVEQLRPLLQPYLDRFYPLADWNLNPAPMISPDHGSRYVMRILSERRSLLGLGSWPLSCFAEGAGACPA